MVLRRVLGWTTVLVVLAYVEAHSWIACTDYLEKNGEYWNQVNCRAFPRHGKDFVNRDGQFGADRGYNINNPNPNNPCRTRRNDPNAYDARHPIAVYYPGQEVVLAHPTKNHVADVCTNKNIPDKGNFIFRGPKDGQSDPSLATFVKKLVADLGVSPTGNNAQTNVYPKPGFQNAPKFCENKDKALATNSFKIPQNLQPGRYTFLWAWFFNSRRDLYTSCWEVDVVETKAQRDAIYTSRKISTADPVDVSKGGSTSGGTTGGSTGGGSTGGGSTGGGSTGGGSTGGGSTGGGSTGGGSTGGGSTSGGSTGGRRESFEIKVEYGQSWGQGALGMIKMPTSRPSGDYRIVLQFKCKAKNINFWHAKDVSTGIQKKLGVYVLSQPEAHMKQKTFVGFNINFGACGKQSAASIVAYILEC